MKTVEEVYKALKENGKIKKLIQKTNPTIGLKVIEE